MANTRPALVGCFLFLFQQNKHCLVCTQIKQSNIHDDMSLLCLNFNQSCLPAKLVEQVKKKVYQHYDDY